MIEFAAMAEQLIADLRILDREEDTLRRNLDAHERFVEAIDWTAMTMGDRMRTARRGSAIEWHLRQVGNAIDQRIFQLVHIREEVAQQPGVSLSQQALRLTAEGALEQFRANAQRMADELMRTTAGGTYEMYGRWFTDAIGPCIEALDPELRVAATGIARNLGYIEDASVYSAGFGPGVCSITGIDEYCCHCGRHP